MLLTSSQVSFLSSTAIIITCSCALFLAGYVLQQQTLRSLQAEIKPQVARLHSRASAKSSTSVPHVFGPSAPAVMHATPLVVPYPDQYAHKTRFNAVVTQTAAPVNNTPAGARGNVDRSGGDKNEWKSRETFDEEASLSRGQERFQKEGDDFFGPVKVVDQAVVGRGVADSRERTGRYLGR